MSRTIAISFITATRVICFGTPESPTGLALPDGQFVQATRQTWHRAQTLIAALAALGVKPGDVRYVAISHIHPDHVGNVEEFPDATLVIQKAEWDYAMTLPQKPFSPEHK